ncbi:MAG: entericidin A/B family lipoprotein [Halioglobus sp.]
MLAMLTRVVNEHVECHEVARCKTRRNLKRQGVIPMTIWRSIFAGMVFVLSVAVAGCNTTQGLGQDVEEAGQATEDAAD